MFFLHRSHLSAITSNEQPQPAAFDTKNLEPDADVLSGDSCTSTSRDSQPISLQNDTTNHPTSKIALSLVKKRYFREEWKFVINDEKATNDRMSNLIINSQDSWGMWCKVCTEWAPKINPKFCTNFVKDYPSFKPPRPKRETVNIHFSSIAHAKCLEREKAKAFEKSPTKAPIYQQLIQIDEQTLKK